jgi:phosphatidylglycerophosphatase A
MRRLSVIFASCCGAGYAPLAPGTAGAAVGLVLVFLLKGEPFYLYAGAAFVLFFLGVKASTVSEEAFGEKDSPRIVIDEAVSMMITMASLPLNAFTVVTGFVLTRFLDIVKPFPAGRLQRLRGGWGVMMDDVVAGVYSNLLLRIVWFLWIEKGL